jgi:hypothetical protein
MVELIESKASKAQDDTRIECPCVSLTLLFG